ncbi:hypothetical protein ACUOFC_52025, partial [Escherichia sp. TWPC-MK]
CGEEGQVEKLMQWLKSGGPRPAPLHGTLSLQLTPRCGDIGFAGHFFLFQ